MRHTLPVLLALAAAAPLSAQSYLSAIAYPNGTTTELGRTTVPLGFDAANTQFDEGRYQILIPATHLPPTGGKLVAMDILSDGYTGSLAFEKLTIDISHTSASQLTMNMNANLPAPVGAIPGFGYSTFVDSGKWTMIFFPFSFQYNGTDNLVLDIQSTYNRVANPLPAGVGVSLQTTSSPARTDLPDAVGTSGAYGSGAATAGTATQRFADVMKVRLVFDSLPTLSVSSDVGGSNNMTFPIGGSMDFQVSAPLLNYGLFIDVAFQPPFTVPFIQGVARTNLATAIAVGQITSSQFANVAVPIPSNPSLIGKQFVLQGLAVDQGITTWQWTNAVDFYVHTN